MSSQPSERSQSKSSKTGSAAVLDHPDNSNDKLQEDRDTLVNILQQMILIRRFEEKCAESYSLGNIGGFCHLYIGQEAVVVGMQLAVSDGDQVITSYRDHGHMLATGMEARGVMAELTGRAGGYSHGKGGSMHMFSKEKNFFGGHGIVGAQVGLGTGLAFSNWYRGNDRVAVTYFGEGASNQGQVFESFNLSALMKLPVIFVIENNKYGMGTHVERASASRDLSKNGGQWGIPGAQVDGMDVLAVEEAARRAAAEVRDGGRPCFLELRTYRFRAHSMYDPDLYRSKDEIERWKEHDPIPALTARLNDAGLVNEADMEQLEQEIATEIEDAIAFAEAGTLEPVGELERFVYFEGTAL